MEDVLFFFPHSQNHIFIFCLYFADLSYLLIFLIFVQEECVLSDPQGESDADADIEDTDCRLDKLSHISCLAVSRPVIFLLWWSNIMPLSWFVKTPRARVSPANKLSETQAPTGIAARHHREWRRRRAEPQISSLEPQAQSRQSAQQDYTGGTLHARWNNNISISLWEESELDSNNWNRLLSRMVQCRPHREKLDVWQNCNYCSIQPNNLARAGFPLFLLCLLSPFETGFSSWCRFEEGQNGWGRFQPSFLFDSVAPLSHWRAVRGCLHRRSRLATSVLSSLHNCNSVWMGDIVKLIGSNWVK